MTHSLPANPSRRSLLKILSGAPLLPLSSGLMGTSLLAACGGSNSSLVFDGVNFSSMPAPTLSAPTKMATTLTESTMTVKFTNGSTNSYALSYQPFFITGQSVADGKGGSIVAGGYFDINNKPIMDTSVAGTARQFFSDCPDGSSLRNAAL